MRIDYLSQDILLFRGDCSAALATAFIDGQRVLLVDALASEVDAVAMRDYLERERGLQIDTILLSHASPGHDAGLHVFGGARVKRPGAASATLHWGRHSFDFFQTPGAAGALAIQAAPSGLLFVGARLAGAVALIGTAALEVVDAALAHLQQRGARQIVPAQLDAGNVGVLQQARDYLHRLGEQVRRARATHAGAGLRAAIAAIPIETCLEYGVHAGALERDWHRDNLKRIDDGGLFAIPPPAPRAPPRSFVCFIRRTGLMPALLDLLGGLGGREARLP